MAEVRRFRPGDLEGVIALCAAEGWPSFPGDPARTLRALTFRIWPQIDRRPE
jgi:hypothetical protein